MRPHRNAGVARRSIVLAATLAPALAATLAASSPSIAAKPLIHAARNAKLHHTILVNGAGRSLYTLSAERHGRFICTDRTCLSFWTPLVVPGASRPTGTGVRSLGTVRRPDGKRQVTYRGRPLYTFNDDGRAGDVNGEGFRDVGVWHAAMAHG
jgi:predicted lipoprotein with Yx(FWY)xxD motif